MAKQSLVRLFMRASLSSPYWCKDGHKKVVYPNEQVDIVCLERRTLSDELGQFMIPVLCFSYTKQTERRVTRRTKHFLPKFDWMEYSPIAKNKLREFFSVSSSRRNDDVLAVSSCPLFN